MIVPLCLSHQTGAWAPILDLLNKEMTASYNHHVMCLRQMYQHPIQKIQDRWSKTRLSSATVWWKTQQVTQRTGNKHHLCDWGRKSPAGAESDSQSSVITVLDLIKPQETQSFFSFIQMLRQRLHVERNEQCVWVNWSIQNKPGWPRDAEVAFGQSLEVGQTDQNRKECKSACLNVDADKATQTTEM